MPAISPSFDLKAAEWRRVTDLSDPDFKVDFEFSLLGYDLASHRLDMLLRYGKGRGHCRRHRHVAATATLVLEGEQFVTDLLPDGTLSKTVHRTKGAYALSAADAHPHNECGGEDGGTVLLSMHAREDSVLFEYFDDKMENSWTLSIAQYVDSWNKGTTYGEAPAQRRTAAE